MNVLKIQLYINLVLALLLIFRYHDIYFEVYLVILILALLVRKNKKIFQLISIIFLPVIFVDQLTYSMRLLIEILPNMSVIIYILYLAGLLVVIIPVTKEAYGVIKNPLFQLLATIWFTTVIAGSSPAKLENLEPNTLLYGLNNSAIIYGLPVFIYVYVVIREWGYRFHFNLPFNFSNKRNVIVLIIAVVLAIWISLFSVFSYLARSWSEVFWNWDLSLINPTKSYRIENIWELFFSCGRAGIIEENERYINLLLLLAIFRKSRRRIEWAIIISSLIFASLHILNVLSRPPYETPIKDVGYQIVSAFGVGCFLAVLLLYTGKLWLTMLLHAFIDVVAFSITSIGIIGNSAILSFFEQTILSLACWLILAVLLFIRNKDLINHNVQILTKNQNLI